MPSGARTEQSAQSREPPRARPSASRARIRVPEFPSGLARFWRYEVHFFRGFRPRSKRTFCRSRRDLAIGVVGTPAFQLMSVSPPRSRPRASRTRIRVPTYPSVLARLWRYEFRFFRSFRPRSKRTFCRSRRDLAIGVVGTPPFPSWTQGGKTARC